MKNEFIATVINEFVYYYKALTARDYLGEYRSRLFFLGEKITVTQGGKTYIAKAVDIDDMCHLIVETDTGERKTLFAGEITVKMK